MKCVSVILAMWPPSCSAQLYQEVGRCRNDTGTSCLRAIHASSVLQLRSKSSQQLDAKRQDCTDGPGWRNPFGFDCCAYVTECWCANGDFRLGQEWTGGATFDYPERICRACGATDSPTPSPTPATQIPSPAPSKQSVFTSSIFPSSKAEGIPHTPAPTSPCKSGQYWNEQRKSCNVWPPASCQTCLGSSCCDVSLPAVLSHNMVLQRGQPVPIWGSATAGKGIKVAFASQQVMTEADEHGKWIITLRPLMASSQPSRMTITCCENKTLKNIEDILVGEVWIASGQSNMEWSIAKSANATQEIASANYGQIRLFDVSRSVAPLPQDKGDGSWQTCQPAVAQHFSAVGYYFGRRLYHELKVPVGLIGANWGGTKIEPWTAHFGFASNPELQDLAEQVSKYTQGTPVNAQSPSAIYNSMIHPLTPFGMRGAIWYQGESNGGEGMTYYHKMHALVKGWRQAFTNDNLAFYWVQLANFQVKNADPAGGDGWAKIREAQTDALDIPRSGMAVTIDVGEAGDIHPRNKQDVGWRLSQWALHQTYDRSDLVPSGPMYNNMKIENAAIRISFKHVGKGLMVGWKRGLEPTHELTDGNLGHFAISGDAKTWHWAQARIDGDAVVVQANEVLRPTAVRYAFAMNPAKANLYNRDGFPAAPFTTDRLWTDYDMDLGDAAAEAAAAEEEATAALTF